MSKIVVTSALPYANGPIHIGHLVEYIQTDIFVRFLKVIGKDAIYCCADDAHGTAIEIKADELKITPQELIKNVHKEHLEDFKKFLIEFDSYYTTDSEENKKFADQIFHALQEKNLIYTKDVESFYDDKKGRFLPDRYVKGKCPKCGATDQYGDVCEKCNAIYKPLELIDPYSTISGTTPIRKTTKHYFFKLSELSEKIEDWLTKNKNLQPEIVNYVKNWIKEGLQDWDISRNGPYFGFKIPGEEDKYYYVWLDAPIGYIASTENYCKQHNLDAEKDYWKNKDSTIIHFIGKDIIYFHFLFWPAMLMEAGFKLPDDIVVHGFLTVNGEKMSKSRGTFITAKEFAEKHNPEHLRYYYAKSLSKKVSDIDLDLKELKTTINNELVANLGNFCYRTLSFINKFFDSNIADIEENVDLINKINDKLKRIEQAYDKCNTNEAIKEILAISDLGNQYLQKNEPWKLVKTDKEKAHKVLGLCANLVKNLAILISPVLPEFSKEIHTQLGLSNLNWKDIHYNLTNTKINEAKIAIKKLKEEEKETFPLNLKVAKILQVEDHPDAEKLYILQLDLKGERRQIVAGIRPYYKKEELIGKNIVLVSNLKPAKLRGIESSGMLLAAEKDKIIKVLEAKDSNPGDQIELDGYESNTAKIKYDVFEKITLEVKDKKIFYNDKPLKTEKEEISVDMPDGSSVG